MTYTFRPSPDDDREAMDQTWQLTDGNGDLVGTINLSTTPERGGWDDMLQTPALYLSQLTVDETRTDETPGQLLLHAAYLYGRSRGVPRLRGDVSPDNLDVMHWCYATGANYLGTANARLQMQWEVLDLAVKDAVGRITVDVDQVEITDVHAGRDDVADIIGGAQWDREAGPAPTHHHTATGLQLEDGQPLRMSDVQVGPMVLHHTGDTWRLWGTPVTGPTLNELRPGLLYQLAHTGLNPACGLAIIGDQVQQDG